MSNALRFVSEIISARTKILLTRESSSLAVAIKNQLSQYSYISLANANDSDVDLIIHFVGFDQSSLDETLHHTSKLHKFLDQALATRAKFILVTPLSASSLHNVSVSLVKQYTQIFALKYEIIEIGLPCDWTDAAFQVVKSFVYLHTKPEKSQDTNPKIQTSTKIQDPKSKKNFVSWSLFLVTLFITPYILYFAQWGVLAGLANCVKDNLLVSNWPKVQQCARPMHTMANILAPQTSWVVGSRELLTFLGWPPEEVLQVIQRSASTVKLVDQASSLWNSELSADNLSLLSVVLSNLSENLAFLQSELKQVYRLPAIYYPQLAAARTQVNKIVQILPDLPQFLALNKTLTYLILIQDNLEIRPTGGFISQFALVTVESGKLGSVELFKTTATDALLRGQVDPPLSLVQATGEKNWYLRDSNWDPHFPESAAKAAWFVQRELARNVDAVLAVNLSAVQMLLETTGPVGQVDAKSLLSSYLTQNHQLFDVLQTLQQRLPNLDQKQKTKIVGWLLAALESRQALLYPLTFTSPSISRVGWDGQIQLGGCRVQIPCLVDTVYAVDSNVGINKANTYLKRDVKIETSFQKDRADVKYKIAYTNTSPTSAWPLGAYKNFLRVYLPPFTRIDSVSSSYTTVNERGFQVLQIPLTVEVGKPLNLEIITHRSLPSSPRFHYQLDVFNQPGMLADTLNLTLSYPAGWFVTSVQQPKVAISGQLEYNATLLAPQRFDIGLVRN